MLARCAGQRRSCDGRRAISGSRVSSIGDAWSEWSRVISAAGAATTSLGTTWRSVARWRSAHGCAVVRAGGGGVQREFVGEGREIGGHRGGARSVVDHSLPTTRWPAQPSRRSGDSEARPAEQGLVGGEVVDEQQLALGPSALTFGVETRDCLDGIETDVGAAEPPVSPAGVCRARIATLVASGRVSTRMARE